ncbi:MAG: 50S ribosomal protein L23 [Planctomycetota bacterium]|jgi:large subunit ribosomal protein L23|nr:50S ribosomal protein L23 [Planctomycetota bacterium]MDP6941837.1 50S ribosomal protein L23 [Planctomycetota bacterium]
MAANSLHYQILLSPVLTEKSTEEQARLNSYRFEVAGGANKIEVRAAIEAVFDVKVKKVNIMVRPGKPRRRGFNSFLGSARKIAVVQLQEGQKIDLL